MLVTPRPDCEIIVATPGIVAKERSSGAATEAAMVSGLAPVRLAVTAMVGKSTRGSAATGNLKYANMPAIRNDTIISVVITGLRMQSSESVMGGRSS